MIRREDQGEIAVLRMEHGKVQALDLELVVAIEQALDEIERGPARALVLTGTGTVFSAGVDLYRVIEEGSGYIERFLAALSSAFRRLFEFQRPAVAAVNGHAIAGGMILSCACDRRLMARGNGRIGVPELQVGVPFPAAPLEIVRTAVPSERLEPLIYRGKRATVDEALAWGLIDEATDPERLLPRALDAARELAALPPAAFALVKKLLRQPALDRLERHGQAHDAEVLRQWTSPQTAEAIRSYLERTVGRSS